MAVNPTQIQKEKMQFDVYNGKMNELIETLSNDGKNHGRSIINRNISNENAIAIDPMNILQKQPGDAHVIEQAARSMVQHNGCPNEGELGVEIAQNSVDGTPIVDISKLYVKRCVELGYKENKNCNGNENGDNSGVLFTQYTRKDGTRHSSFRSYIAPLFEKESIQRNKQQFHDC